jgi:hypothetical protein
VRARTCGVVLAAVFAGMLFTPVFGAAGLAVPLLVPAAAVLLVALLCTRPGPRSSVRDRHPVLAGPGSALAEWRPVLTAGAGLLAVVETALRPTTLAGLPTVGTLRALAAGATDSWRLVLQSTWPARPEPELLLFVPLLVVLAAVLGVEALHRLRGALPALLPSLAVVVLSQLYATLAPGPAVAAALGYAALGAVLAFNGFLTQAIPSAAAMAVAALLAGLLLPAGPPRYALRPQEAPVSGAGLTNPLDEVAARLAEPHTPVFRVHGATDVDRWPVVVLDRFDGVNWTPADRFRRLGSRLPPGPGMTVGAGERGATIETAAGAGPWLPSQTWPSRVGGAAPLVAEGQGTLLLPGTDGGVRYGLHWWQPQVTADELAEAPIDSAAPGGYAEVADLPPAVEALAAEAVRGNRPSFATALALEEWFRAGYHEAIGAERPTGHGWPQLTDFLLTTKRGTSEQFAAGYVAVARFLGIPARLAVGYRMPAQAAADGWTTIRNGDVLAWPEVAVREIGWVPLDPTGGASASGAPAGSGLAALTERARQTLPPPEELRDPEAAPASRPGAARAGGVPWTALLVLPALPLVGWPLAVPAAWGVRSWRRRRRPGAGAVVGAWEEVRDRLRAYGVPVTPGMTVRDLGAAAAPLVDAPTVAEIQRLAVLVDEVLWSPPAATTPGPSAASAPAFSAVPVPGRSAASAPVVSVASSPAVEQAWDVVRAVRRGLARRGLRLRLRALLDVRGLRRP